MNHIFDRLKIPSELLMTVHTTSVVGLYFMQSAPIPSIAVRTRQIYTNLMILSWAD